MNLFPLIVGLVVLFLVFLVTAVAMMGAEKKRKQRMLAMIRGQSSELRRVDEKDAHNKRREEIARKLKETGDDEKGKKKRRPSGFNWNRPACRSASSNTGPFRPLPGLF